MFWATIFALLAIATIYVWGGAWWIQRAHPHFRIGELILPRMFEVVIVGWMLWVSSAIGSFLNVVAWRMPLGRGLGGRSHCPRCGTQLLARDNFPVLGWMAVQGRCRTCRLPISPRYPIVEAAVGLSLTSIGIAVIHGFSPPGQTVDAARSVLHSRVVDPGVWYLLGFQVVELSVGWAFGLIRFDGNRLPSRLVTFAAITLLVIPLMFPSLLVVDWRFYRVDQINDSASLVSQNWQNNAGILDAVARLLTALAAAGFAGRSLARGLCNQADLKLSPLADSSRRLVDLILMIAVPAVIVGWQALPSVLVAASLLALLIPPRWADALGRFAITLPIATSIQIVVWSATENATWWPGSVGDPWVMILAAACVLAIPWWLHEPAHSKNSPQDDDSNRVDASDRHDTAEVTDTPPNHRSSVQCVADPDPDDQPIR
ncbi:prepilin peptidase [Crateriforma spongiae]|uniref:prepilin peptidase n=1 Tax=Crateriforma spongiae TaxID=2724528 RepID=UPI00197CDC13|nr:A24 family peptidase [Crateriforma spongiae]